MCKVNLGRWKTSLQSVNKHFKIKQCMYKTSLKILFTCGTASKIYFLCDMKSSKIKEKRPMICAYHIEIVACGDFQIFLNPLSPTSDLHRISPYTINMISSRQVMRVKKNIN